MEQATQPTTPTVQHDREARASYRRARTLVDQLVDQVPTLPNAAEAHQSFALHSYEARLHFGTGFAAGRGVLETAALTDAAPTRDERRDDETGALVGYWISLRTVVDGVPLSAWAQTTRAEADRLLPPAETTKADELQQQTTATETADSTEHATEVTQPLPTVGVTPADVVVPALVAVAPLATKTTEPEAGR